MLWNSLIAQALEWNSGIASELAHLRFKCYSCPGESCVTKNDLQGG